MVPDGLTPEMRERLTREYEAKRRWKREGRKLHHFHTEYSMLNRNQTKALSVVGMRYWLLQGPQLVRENLLISDVFFKISSFVLNCSFKDAQEIYSAVHLKLFSDMTKEIDEKIYTKTHNKNNKGFSFLYSLFYPEKKLNAKRQQAIERCEKRVLLSK
jgi:hypothetical protein